MPVVMYVLHVPAENACLTATNSTAARRQMQIPLRKKCSILSVPSMWQEDVPTAASAAESVLRESPFTCLTESLSRTLICFTESFRQERTQSQKGRSQALHLTMQSQAVCEKGDNVCIR